MVRCTQPVNSMRHNGDWLAFVARVGLLLFGQSLVFAQDDEERLHPPLRSAVGQYCLTCHDADVKKANLDLESIVEDPAPLHTKEWEQVIRKLRARQMPPANRKQRPNEATYQAILSRLEASLDAAAVKDINPGRTETLRRLNR